jgi:hypothetical protein
VAGDGHRLGDPGVKQFIRGDLIRRTMLPPTTKDAIFIFSLKISKEDYIRWIRSRPN